MARFDLSDEKWGLIGPLLPKQGRGPKRKDDRKILNGIFYILRTGAPWRDLPERYGPRTTGYGHFGQLQDNGAGMADGRAMTETGVLRFKRVCLLMA